MNYFNSYSDIVIEVRRFGDQNRTMVFVSRESCIESVG